MSDEPCLPCSDEFKKAATPPHKGEMAPPPRKLVMAGDGTVGSCKYCERRIEVAGSWWLDSDGRKECIRGMCHSVSGTSSMPHRLLVPE